MDIKASSQVENAKHCAGVKETPNYFLTGLVTKIRISSVRNPSPREEIAMSTMANRLSSNSSPADRGDKRRCKGEGEKGHMDFCNQYFYV